MGPVTVCVPWTSDGWVGIATAPVLYRHYVGENNDMGGTPRWQCSPVTRSTANVPYIFKRGIGSR